MTIAPIAPPSSAPPAPPLTFLWLELTGKCQLECVHCYNHSGPAGSEGSMTYDDWIAVIDQAAALGVSTVQMIGGEPTLYAGLPGLVTHALGRGMEVEVYSNLVRVTPALWELFAQPGVRLATSYYTDDPAQHLEITRRNALPRTRANIGQAVAMGIPLRVGIVDLGNGQRIDQAKADLAELGITDVGVDRMRILGRPAGGGCDAGELCGRCGSGIASILPDGSMTVCPLGRWLRAGDVREKPVADLYAGAHQLAREHGLTVKRMPVCAPDGDGQCEPKCRPGCDPALGCRPPGGDPPPPPSDDD
ncbi:radical SAM protein [Nonomuraea sp. NPDC023979]|uniref:radical SAM protein n=1 Tax=Nonomuraea sp. NPDC023979 TaxID=3154796 RepID=UPI0033FFD639